MKKELFCELSCGQVTPNTHKELSSLRRRTAWLAVIMHEFARLPRPGGRHGPCAGCHGAWRREIAPAVILAALLPPLPLVAASHKLPPWRGGQSAGLAGPCALLAGALGVAEGGWVGGNAALPRAGARLLFPAPHRAAKARRH